MVRHRLQEGPRHLALWLLDGQLDAGHQGSLAGAHFRPPRQHRWALGALSARCRKARGVALGARVSRNVRDRQAAVAVGSRPPVSALVRQATLLRARRCLRHRADRRPIVAGIPEGGRRDPETLTDPRHRRGDVVPRIVATPIIQLRKLGKHAPVRAIAT